MSPIVPVNTSSRTLPSKRMSRHAENAPTNPPVVNPFALPASEVLEKLGVCADIGLSACEVTRRRELYGPNRMQRQESRGVWSILFDQFKGIIIVLLLAAMGLSAAAGDWLEFIAIGVVIVLNAGIGFVSELRAVRSMEALRKLSEAHTTVRRDGGPHRIPADQLVPGDIVLLAGGDMVPADMRIVTASMVEVNESTLTGESLPVTKNGDPVEPDSVLADRSSMLFTGTGLVRGSCECVVCSTAMDTELGLITTLMMQTPEKGLTPLERRLESLAKRVVWFSLAIAAIVGLLGYITGEDPYLILKTSIALAIAAVPEGLPIVTTLALARGMWLMAHRNALINHL
jgi:P-type Ca2+ transporter type 2C